MLKNNQTTKQIPSRQEKKPQPFYVVKFKVLVLIIVLLIVVPGYYFLIKPQYLKYKSNSVIVNRLEKELQINLKQLNSNKKMLLDYQFVNPLDKEKIERILPNQPDLANLYINLQAIVQKNNVDLSGITINPVKVKQKKIIFPKQQAKEESGLDLTANVEINLELKGLSYAKMKKLFHDLETNLRLLDVINFNFNPSDGNLSLSMLAYNLKN